MQAQACALVALRIRPDRTAKAEDPPDNSISTRLRLTARKVWLSFSEAYSYARDIARILANLDRHPA